MAVIEWGELEEEVKASWRTNVSGFGGSEMSARLAYYEAKCPECRRIKYLKDNRLKGQWEKATKEHKSAFPGHFQ